MWLLVAVQPARASPLARYAPAITIGCFVVEVENPRPLKKFTSWIHLKTGIINEHLPLNEIKPAIARWNGLDETNQNMKRRNITFDLHLYK